MSEQTATERLRELLDERGVKYDTYGERYGTWYDTPLGGHVYVPENNAGYLHVRSDAMTPEQAIAATLGAGTCKDVCANISEFTCSACGFNCELASWISLFDGDDGRHRHHYHGTPNFCPNCGRKVVDE